MSKHIYHGILVDASFSDPSFLQTFRNFAKRRAGSWLLHGVEIPSQDLTRAVDQIQKAMKADRPYYAHLYNDEEVVVVFKDRAFHVGPHASTWRPIVEYGRSLSIPEEQLDFWPNRFQDERHYFKPEDLAN